MMRISRCRLRLIAITKVIILISLACSPAQAKLNVVASLPEYGALAREVGGNEVSVTSLAAGTEDAHFVNPRPSYIRVLNKADVLIENGADMEAGWLPPLVEASRNPKLVFASGSPTRILAAEFVDMLEVPTVRVDRSMGDVHPFGNPHFHLNPVNAIEIAKALKEKFCFLQPTSCPAFMRNFDGFEQKVRKKLREWKEQATQLRGVTAVEYHRTFVYLAELFGFHLVGRLEPKPGIPPSAGHIRELIPRMKAMNVKLILIEPFHERKTPAFISEQTGAKVVVLPSTVCGVPGTDDYFRWMDTIVSRLVEATTGS